MRHLTSADLPEDIARRAEALVAAGRFSSIEEVIRGGVEALDRHEDVAREWLDYLRKETIAGFTEIDRGESVCGTPTGLMTAIRAEIAKREGR